MRWTSAQNAEGTYAGLYGWVRWRLVFTDAFVLVGKLAKLGFCFGVNLVDTQREQLQTNMQVEGPRKATPL